MGQIDRAAIVWSVAIVALGVGFAGFESQSQGTISNTDYIDTISEVKFDLTVVHVNIQYIPRLKSQSDLAKLEYQFGFKNLAQAEPKF